MWLRKLALKAKGGVLGPVGGSKIHNSQATMSETSEA